MWWRVSQALIRIIISSCSFERPALPVCVCVSGYVTVMSFTLFLKRKAQYCCMQMWFCCWRLQARICVIRRNPKVMFCKNISNTWRVGKDGYCLYLSPAHPAVSWASTVLDHRHLGMLSPLLLFYWSWLAQYLIIRSKNCPINHCSESPKTFQLPCE